MPPNEISRFEYRVYKNSQMQAGFAPLSKDTQAQISPSGGLDYVVGVADPAPVMQATKALDDQGVHIFESDILEVVRPNGTIERLLVVVDYRGITLEYPDGRTNRLDAIINFGCTVIGNIHENPELFQ